MNNAYKVSLPADRRENIADWWYGTSNHFSHHGYHTLNDGRVLLMADVSPSTDAVLESAVWCESFSHCRVDSPQVGDTEPAETHETIDGGDQLLWVS